MNNNHKNSSTVSWGGKMSWLFQGRESFSHVSTHQTYVGKALFEHAPNCATIAAVACMSSSLLKSSLGPNLLALIRVEYGTLDLFDKIFLEYNPHMQLTQKLGIDLCVRHENSKKFIEKLKSNGPLFSSSLQEANMDLCCLSLLAGFRALRSLTLTNTTQSGYLPCLKSLPLLSELTLVGCRTFDAPFFKAIGDLENNRNLTSLVLSDFHFADWCSEGFQKDVCGRLLSKNQLTKLNWTLWNRMTEDDQEAFVNARMSNLLELRNFFPAKLIRGEGFGNLRTLSVESATGEDLVNIGNHCLFLEVLNIESTCVSRSLQNEKNLVENAFKQLRELLLDNVRSGFDVGTLFASLLSLEKLSMKARGNIDGSFLHQLPNPDRLRTMFTENGKFLMSDLHRFVNLEEIDLNRFQLSREDILSFGLFKQLKRITLAHCGEHVASSEPFRVLGPQWMNLEKLVCYGWYPTRWTEGDVEAILIGCKWLQRLEFRFERHDADGAMDCKRMVDIKKKYHWVTMEGVLQKNEAAKQESGSRREREE